MLAPLIFVIFLAKLLVIIQYNLLNIEYSWPVRYFYKFAWDCEIREIMGMQKFRVLQ